MELRFIPPKKKEETQQQATQQSLGLTPPQTQQQSLGQAQGEAQVSADGTKVRIVINTETAGKKAGLDGQWVGMYYYGEEPPPESARETRVGNVVTRTVTFAVRFLDPGGAPNVPFRATLKTSGEALEGTIYETVSRGGRILNLTAAVMGAVDAEGGVRFLKRYDGTGGAGHAVEYQGKLSADGRTIQGTWRLPLAGGGFVMRR